MVKKKTQNSTPVSIRFIIIMVSILLLGAVVFALMRLTSPDSAGTQSAGTSGLKPDQRLTGTVSELTVNQWGIKLSFKDADKVTYKITNPNNDPLELYVNSTYLYPTDCGRLGISIWRTNQPTPGSNNVQVGNYYYHTAGASGYCSSTQKDSQQAVNLEGNLVSEIAGGRNISYSISQ